jgi:hypothetical protein
MDLAGLSSIIIESVLGEAGERPRISDLGPLYGDVGVATENNCTLHMSSCMAAEAARRRVWAILDAEMAQSSSSLDICWADLPMGVGVVGDHVSHPADELYVDSILL